MNYIKQLVGVLDLISSKKRVGKTFIQKGMFLLQNGLKEDFDFNYRIHFYGPYSQEVTDILDDLEDMNLVTINYDEDNQKYNISLTTKGKDYLQEKEQFRLPQEDFGIIKSLIGDVSVEKMELISTILYFAKLTDNDSQCIDEVLIAKPQYKGKIREIKQEIKKLEKLDILQFGIN